MQIAVPKEQVLEFLSKNKLKLSTVTQVTQQAPEPVFDISIECETIPLEHSFIANGFVTHNSVMPDYVDKMMRTYGISQTSEQIFGLMNPKTQKWEIRPQIRIYQEGVGEKFFDYLAKLERALPDKKLMGDTWYYVYENTKPNKKLVGDRYDKKYYSRTGLLRVEAPDGKLQAILLLDSYPAMLPEKQDVDDPGSAIAVQARMFAEQLKRVKGKMRAKRIAVLGVNQLRKAPMVLFGSPEQEPGGEALKFFCMSGDTLVQTDSGLLYATEIDGEKKLPNVLGEAGLESPTIFAKTGISAIVEATTEFGFQVRGKPTHRVRAVREGQVDFEWVKLKDLRLNGVGSYYVPVKVGGNVFSTRLQTVKYSPVQGKQCDNKIHKVPESICVDEDFASVVGYLVSEGYVRNGHVIFTNHDSKLLKNYSKLFNKVFGIKPVVGENECRLYSVEIGEMLVGLGAGGELSRFKEVPRCIRKSPADVQLAFLKALFEGDGNFSRTKSECSYSSISNKLLDQVHLMLINFGVFGRKTPYSIKYTDHHLEASSEINRAKMEEVLSMESHARFKHLYNFGSLYISGYSKRLLEKLLFKGDEVLYDSRSNTMSSTLPDILGWRNGLTPRLKEWISNLKQGRKYFRLTDFYVGWEEDADTWVTTLRTDHERIAVTSGIDKLSDFISYTRDNCLTWVKVTDVRVLKEQMTYDFNMPVTHTVVTNGVVSHNSDVRLKATPRSLSGVPVNGFKGKGMIMEEDSISGGGTDKYRFIHIKAIKNKLSLPYHETWVRLWIEDSTGEARGFDPVWDCFYYLINTGQLEGDGKKMTIMLSGRPAFKKPISWKTFKTFILGTPKQRKDVSIACGLTKTLNLREFCTKQLDDGDGLDLYIAKKSAPVKKSLKIIDESGDDDDD